MGELEQRILSHLQGRLSKKRLTHTLATAQTAALLASRFGYDPHKAYVTGLLHDCMREENLQNLLLFASKSDIIIRNEEKQSVSLLHAPASALLARQAFGADEEMFWAIRWHTLGKEDMTTAEKICWLADYIEPNRTHEGVEEVRQLAETDLDGALLRAMTQSLRHLRETGAPLCEQTVKAWEFLRNTMKNGAKEKS
ncbi:MAG: bis(5'-nucleosyl)-tetraphosphatase (symmetrical) YqeK [Clostridia bacterium]|nr:bis(5'-nucleosyl)-tetraphosphatase (symmetrical) YqeK [Clostridia bacterium]